MFGKLLIANRGEIACRIIKTAARLGIKTVAIYSEADKNAQHVLMADEAYCVGPPPSIDSYLNRAEILNIAKNTKVDAIHPGYGFLAEDPLFAEQCNTANIIFVGPSAATIAKMADKNQAKIIVQQAGIPIAPSFHPTAQQDWQHIDNLAGIADQIGYPLMIKATAGGGGKGMRLVEDSSQLTYALEGARREAKASFGDDRVFLEKYIAQARHVEVQIFCDSQGNGLYLFDRDCSIQRRHQKVIEEAPAPFITDTVRHNMADAALLAAKLIDYQGAGTIEFLLESNGYFYFMEMNTRLQVEHPVTEMITGFDLVEWQLRVAAGEPLPRSQQDIVCRGHAIEARIYAEDPFHDFLPTSGTLTYYHMPTPEANQVRIDTGVGLGDTISIYYDPMIAKLIVHSEDRNAAIQQLQQSLSATYILGMPTNVSFLHRIANHPALAQHAPDTEFINRYATSLLAIAEEVPSTILLAAAYALLQQQQSISEQLAHNNEDNHSPWLIHRGWKNLEDPQVTVRLWRKNQQTINHWTVAIPFSEQPIVQMLEQNDQTLICKITIKQSTMIVVCEEQQIHVFADGELYSFLSIDPTIGTGNTDMNHENHSNAPMPGTLIKIYVTVDQAVNKGEPLAIMEAMKMEHTIKASKNGIVRKIFLSVGDRVQAGDQLFEIE